MGVAGRALWGWEPMRDLGRVNPWRDPASQIVAAFGVNAFLAMVDGLLVHFRAPLTVEVCNRKVSVPRPPAAAPSRRDTWSPAKRQYQAPLLSIDLCNGPVRK